MPLLDSVERLQAVSGGVDAFWLAAIKELENYGVTSVLYAAAGFKSELNKPRITRSLFVRTNHPREFVETFGHETLLDLDDYSAEWCTKSTNILTWHDWENDCSTPDQIRRADLERQMGLHVGVTVPMTALTKGHNGGIGLSLAAIPADAFNDHWKKFGNEILAICSLMDSQMRRTHISEMVSLSKRERECLELIAAGLKVCQLGDAMGISDKTVEKYLPSARRKLKAATTEQAIARALLFNVISP